MIYDYVIAGAGIIGLTVADALKKQYPNSRIAILEKEARPGVHASGRNSGVLHSGIYYASDSLKAKVCAKGAKQMLEFADEHKIKSNKSGKVIIALCEKDLLVIDQLIKNATENGIRYELLNAEDICKIEPHANPYKVGIYSPDTAVIDSIGVVNKLHGLLVKKGVDFYFNQSLLRANTKLNTIWTQNEKYKYGYFINCAGANADIIAHLFNVGNDYTLLPFKGTYYKLSKSSNHLVKSSIYPVPDVELPFLGVHLTRVVSGDVYIGPTAIPAFGRENYGIFSGIKISDGLKIGYQLSSMYYRNNQNFRRLVKSEIKKYFKSNFINEVRKLVPEVREEDLELSSKVGIRPQLINKHKKSLELDYIIEKTESSLHVLNSISPAFTSSFAFASLLIEQL